MKVKKSIIFFLGLVAVFFFLGRELNPLNPHLFSFHDNTQAGRIQEFALNLQNGIIPPRLAPNFSFQHGLPIFNFYAPFTYWFGSFFHLAGISSAISLKLILFFGLIGAFVSFFLFGSLIFGFWGGILGASVYASSLWMAVEIFVRGNVGEIWFLALLPLSLFFMKKNDDGKKGWIFLVTGIVLSWLFTVHNVLSLISVPFIFFFSLTLRHEKKAMASLAFGLLIASYFLLPAALENRLTYANEIASRTKYEDHFLCAWQLWRADKWSYGGDGPGCVNDDMSFQIGKTQLIVAGMGLLVFLYSLRKKRMFQILPWFIFGWTTLSALLTLSISQPIWDLLSPVMKLFQFPWRFLPFIVFGTGFFAAYISQATSHKKIQVPLVVLFSVLALYMSGKFFSRPWEYSTNEYNSMFLTNTYIQKKAAYEIPEYFPRSGDYDTWRTYNTSGIGFPLGPLKYIVNTPFHKVIQVNEKKITLPIHYFPFWTISINGTKIIPYYFDKLGRPVFSNLSPHSTIIVQYNETPIEKMGDIVTLATLGSLLFICFNKKTWKRTSITLQ